MNKLKVAHILNSVGGVDVSLRLITENINSSVFESIIIHGIDDTKHNFSNNKGEIIKEYKISIQRDINVIKDINAIYNTIKILKKEKPQIIHAHSAKGGIIAKIASWYLHIPVLHTPQAYSYLSAQNRLKRVVYLFIEKLFKFGNNKILASSNSELNRAINEVGYPQSKVLLFNNSILPITTFGQLSINKTWPDNYICSVGRPSYQKNIELMIDVIKQVKKSKNDIHLVLMGVGFHSPNLNQVKEKINTLELQNNITLIEWTSREDIFHIINHSKLYFTTARYEGLPYSVIESLALSKPIVATNCDGNRDLVKNNYNGYLIDNNNVTEMSAAILNLFSDEETYNKFSNNSKKRFDEEFDMTRNIHQLENIYQNNLKK